MTDNIVECERTRSERREERRRARRRMRVHGRGLKTVTLPVLGGRTRAGQTVLIEGRPGGSERTREARHDD